MYANYHSHTWRCQHASGTEKEYVESAIQGGLKILGFSDHVPVPFEGGYKSRCRMRVDQLEDYVTTILDLKKEYSREIEIHLGFEVEYFSRYIDKQLEMMKPYPIEYFILGQHFLGDENGGDYCGAPTTNPETLVRYCRICSEALDTGLFTYFAHPDVIRFSGNDELYEREMRTLCEKAHALSMPLEINLLGIEDNRNYPNDTFWRIAGETGCTAILGSDAHRVYNMVRPDAIEAAHKLAERHHLPVIDTVELVNPLA